MLEPRTPERSLLIVLTEEGGEDLIALGETFARRPSREVILAGLVADEAALAAASRRLLAHRESLAARGIPARVAAFTSSSPGEDAVRLTAEQNVDLLLATVARNALGERGFPSDTAALLQKSPCDVALLVAREDRAPPDGSDAGAVIALFGGGEHDWAAAELGAWIARATELPLRLLGRLGDENERDASRTLARASLALQRALGVAAEPALAWGREGVLEAVEPASLLVIGLSTRWRQEGIGPTRLTLALEARPPVVLARRGLRPGVLAPPESLTRFSWSIAAGSA
jgi:hypothetical protein